MKQTNKVAIKLRAVTKTYTLHHHKPTLSDSFVRRTRQEKFNALSSITLTINKGEKVGILGHNGSGKTTLLKIISGITAPSKGTVRMEGKIVSLIDLEAGFHPDLTGEENIFLNGLIIGMTKREITEKKQSIIEYADIGKFIDAPLYTYSAGMKLRLGFSIAIHANPDILILDEGVSAGDQDFQKKTVASLESFFRQKKTIIFVTHWLDFMQKNAKRVIWMEKGKVKRDGGLKVIEEYKSTFKSSKS